MRGEKGGRTVRRRRWPAAVIAGVFCGIVEPILGVWTFLALQAVTNWWRGDREATLWTLAGVTLAGRPMGQGLAFVLACAIVLPGPSAAVLGGLGAWLLLWCGIAVCGDLRSCPPAAVAA